MNAHNEQHDPACIAAYEQLFQADSRDPSQTERLAVWAMSWNAARAAEPSPVVKQNLTTQPAAAQEAVGWQWRWLDTDNTWSEWVDGGSRKEIDARIARWKADGEDHRMQVRPVFAAPVTAAPADLIERCKEILAWQRTGVLPGDALRAYANARWPDEHDPLQIAEKETAREAFRILARAAAASTPAAPGIDLAADHDGMRVDHSGLFKQVRAALRDEPGLAEMVRQLHGHLVALGRRWYAGDKKVVDELLQLYCIEPDARRALIDASPKDELESWKRGTKACAEVLGQVMRQTQDSPKGGSDARDAVLAELVEAISAFKGKRGAFMALGAQDERTVRLWWALANAQAGDAEVQP